MLKIWILIQLEKVLQCISIHLAILVHNSQYTNLHSLGLRKAAIFPILGFLNVVWSSLLSLEFGMITEYTMFEE